jgi:hypothetical protein
MRRELCVKPVTDGGIIVAGYTSLFDKRKKKEEKRLSNQNKED